MTDGGGASRPLAQPIRTMNSQGTASVTGSTKPRAGRVNRAQRFSPPARRAGLPSTTIVMPTRDMVACAKAMRPERAKVALTPP